MEDHSCQEKKNKIDKTEIKSMTRLVMNIFIFLSCLLFLAEMRLCKSQYKRCHHPNFPIEDK